MGRYGSRERGEEGRTHAGDDGPTGPARGLEEERLGRLMEEFRERQRRRPELVVRPWWAQGPDGPPGRRGSLGFVVEYCPDGVQSVEIAVRLDRVRLDGPGGVRELGLALEAGWWLDGEDTGSPALLANHLLSRADGLLSEAA